MKKAVKYLDETYGRFCYVCLSPHNLEIDHITPRSRDKSRIDDVTNMVYLCRSCHYSKHHEIGVDKFNKKFLNDII